MLTQYCQSSQSTTSLSSVIGPKIAPLDRLPSQIKLNRRVKGTSFINGCFDDYAMEISKYFPYFIKKSFLLKALNNFFSKSIPFLGQIAS